MAVQEMLKADGENRIESRTGWPGRKALTGRALAEPYVRQPRSASSKPAGGLGTTAPHPALHSQIAVILHEMTVMTYELVSDGMAPGAIVPGARPKAQVRR
jgi:hypothetical protein